MAFWNSSKSVGTAVGGIGHDRTTDPIGKLDAKLIGSLADSFRDMNLPNAASRKVAEKSSSSLSPEKQLFAYKAEALAMAKQMASEREKAYNEAKAAGLDVGKPKNFKPTMTDYFLACEKLGERKREEMSAKGISWKPETYSDLSGHTLTGMQINKAHIEPGTEVKLTATLRAVQLAKADNRPIKNADILAEIGKIQRSNEKISATPEAIASMREEIKKSGVEGLEDVMDLDGDCTLAFYEKTNAHLDFKGTVFDKCNFYPSGTVMRDDENGIPWTDQASFVSCEFDGLGATDKVALAGKEFRDNRIINSDGGTVIIPDSTQVYDLTLGGKFAELQIGHALVSGLKTDNARIIELQTADGAEIRHAVFNEVTISMNSQMANSKWADVTFNKCNFADVETRNMSLTNVAFKDCTQLDLSGAQIGDRVAVNGTEIKPGMSEQQLAALGVTIDASTQFTRPQAPQPVVAQAAPTPAIDSRAAEAIAVALAMASSVRGGADVSVNDFTLNTEMAIRERTVDQSQVATPGDSFMSADQGQA